MADIFDDTEDLHGDMDGLSISGSNQAPAEEELADDVADFELSLKKKRKKKKKKDKKAKKEEVKKETDNDAWEGSDRDYTYTELLERVFALVRERNPNFAVRKKHSMPPPQLNRVGSRKTMWSNFARICQVMHRSQTHVQSFFLAELGTDGSIDGSQRIIFKGRFLPKNIESLLKKYIAEYVTCHMCRNPETSLTRDPITRLYFVQCEACSARRSVAPIRSGFHAQSRAERRAARA